MNVISYQVFLYDVNLHRYETKYFYDIKSVRRFLKAKRPLIDSHELNICNIYKVNALGLEKFGL